MGERTAIGESSKGRWGVPALTILRLPVPRRREITKVIRDFVSYLMEKSKIILDSMCFSFITYQVMV
jgi:hypothetical protein